MEELKTANHRCEFLQDPVGLDIESPRLSWEIESSLRNTTQTAYELRVALNKDDLVSGTNPVWESGLVQSDASNNVEYCGPEFKSRTTYYWSVKIWDNHGNESEWSPAAFWETGILSPSDWKAKWIEPEQRPAQPEVPLSFQEMEAFNQGNVEPDYSLLNPSQFLRKEFSISKEIQKVRIYATAHGVYSLFINGKRTGNHLFAPEITSYHNYLNYTVYDATGLVKEGDNAIGAVIADGWYAGKIGMMGDSCNYGTFLGFFFQMEIEYTDGSTETVISDRNFKSATGPFIYSDIFIGEKYDARLEFDGWSQAGFDDSSWKPVIEKDYPLDNLHALYEEKVTAIQEIKYIKVITTPKGETVLDVGQNITGRMRMTVTGQMGDEVRLQHSEVLDEHGNFLMNIIGRNKNQTDTYILKGEETEVYEPEFSFHGFRYVKIDGYPGTINSSNFSAVVLSTELKTTGNFECSNSDINQLQHNIFWSQRGNTLSIPTDCPQRERAGWTGDIQIFAPTASYLQDINPFLSRWMDNLAADQMDDGQVPIIVPYFKCYKDTHSGMFDSHCSAGWGDAAIIIPWVLYQNYGDTRILKKHYPAMLKWIQYIEKEAAEKESEGEAHRKYIWNTGFHFGDWLTPSLSVNFETGEVDMMKSAFETNKLVPTCFYAYSADLMSHIATLLGNADDAAYYKDLNRKVREAFALEYMNQDGTMAQHIQGIYILALQFGMVPEEMRPKVFSHLEDLIIKNDYKLDTGFLSIAFLMDVLQKHGRIDLAYKLLYQKECPSWLYEVDKGATTIWEAWQAVMPNGHVSNVSFNHYAYGCVGDWMYRTISGIRKDDIAYKKIIIKPEPDESLSWASSTFHSMYGKISSSWKKQDGSMELKVSIPANTQAEIYIKAYSPEAVKESGRPLSESKGLSVKGRDAGFVIINAGSGNYTFTTV